jgi:hypothetical protein
MSREAGPREALCANAINIERRGLGCGGSDDPDAIVIEHVDQGDETARFAPLLGFQHRDLWCDKCAAALVIERGRLAAITAGELAEALIDRGLGTRISRREIEIAPLQLLEPVILGRPKLMVSMRSSISPIKGVNSWRFSPSR